jgi:hypothetical protein
MDNDIFLNQLLKNYETAWGILYENGLKNACNRYMLEVVRSFDRRNVLLSAVEIIKDDLKLIHDKILSEPEVSDEYIEKKFIDLMNRTNIMLTFLQSKKNER